MEEICDFIKNLLPITIAISFPLFILMPITLTYGSHEFSVYRMQHIGLYGIAETCNGISFSSESKNIKTWLSTRHCILVRLKDLTAETYMQIGNRASALFIVLPKEINSLQSSDLMKMVEVEEIILTSDIDIRIFFVHWHIDLVHIMNDMEVMLPNGNEDGKPSTLTVLWNSIFAMGYHVTINAPKPKLIQHPCFPILQGKLEGRGTTNRKSRSIILVAHYDSSSAVPQLSYGADSNGSGVATLLELARIFSKFYAESRSHPSYDIIFVLSGGGKMNYLGTKKWLEDQLDSTKTASLISSPKNVAFVVCIDSLASENNLHVHVSKPPKNGTAMAIFVQMLNRTSQGTVKLVHKKINLSDNKLSWEHERFSLKRLPAFTLSSLQNNEHWKRNTMFDMRSLVDDNVLHNRVEYLSETLFNFVYNNTKLDALLGHNVQRESLQAWVDHLSTHPRHMQMLSNKKNPFIASLYSSFSGYVRNANITCIPHDKVDSEYEFYDVTKASIYVYSVKPAIFDLVLTIVIAAYLSVIYISIQNFSLLYSSMVMLCSVNKRKDN